MKKLITIVLCALFLSALTLTVSAVAYMGLIASKTTLYPGDEFTISVNLSNSDPVGRGGIVLNYNTSAFEILGGSCNVSGATLGEVSASRNGGVFALTENRVVSGTIFTIRMRVRDNAPLGSYTISGTASMDVACSAGSVSVSVNCAHSYDTLTPMDRYSHRRACSLCGDVQVADHSWNAGTVTKAATCVETGIATYTCIGCGCSKEEVLSKNQNHVYGQWTRVDGNNHSGSCTLCGQQATVSHTWNEGTVVEAATCTQTGLKDQTCTGCGETARVQIPVQPHNYSAFQPVDENKHTHRCAVCGAEEALAHSFTGSYRHNINEHYRLCDGCGYQSAGAAHTPGAAATDTTPQLCTDCGRVLRPAGNHVHSYEESWSADEEAHYYACQGCNEQSGLQLHRFTDDCDESCDICGYVRTAPHDFDDDLTGDGTGHYYPCRNCAEKADYVPHTPGQIASIAAAQTCTACGWELAPRLEHEHDYSFDHQHLCACGEAAPENGECVYCKQTFPWWIVCIAQALAITALLVIPTLKEKTIHK